MCSKSNIFFWHFKLYDYMKLNNILFHKTAFQLAFEKEIFEIIKILLTNNKLNLNIPYKIKITFFNTI